MESDRLEVAEEGNTNGAGKAGSHPFSKGHSGTPVGNLRDEVAEDNTMTARLDRADMVLVKC